jgi:putative tricarboxylic transport membrane protein
MRVDRVLGCLAVLLAIPVAVASWRFDIGSVRLPGPGFWPFLIAVSMLGLGAALVLRPAPAPAGAAEAPSRWRNFWIGMGTLVFYVLALEPVGYLLTTLLVLLVQFRFVEERPWRGSLVTAVVAAAVSLVLFRTLLKVPLPLGILPLPQGW